MLKMRLSGVLLPIDTRAANAITSEAFQQALEEMRGILLARLESVVGTQYDTPASLRAKNYPYARVHDVESGAPSAPKGYLNKQSGDFFDSFVIEVRSTNQGKFTLVMTTDMPERNAMLVRGTEFLIGRNFGFEIARGIGDEFIDAVQRELSAIMTVRRTR